MRRLLPVLVRPKEPDFRPDLTFYEKLKDEAEGVVQTLLANVRGLLEDEYHLPESERTKEYMACKRALDNPLPEFMETCFDYREDAATPSAEMYRVYQRWCQENGLDAVRSRVFYHWLADNGMKYGVKISRHIKLGLKECRGFIGLSMKPEWVGMSSIMV